MRKYYLRFVKQTQKTYTFELSLKFCKAFWQEVALNQIPLLTPPSNSRRDLQDAASFQQWPPLGGRAANGPLKF